ncbi:MAG: CPBP family intramembrane metalloprotease [Phycisphaerae bacterium]|nr:CPBP family intramembrane metalloprotease [Phycisphaerae bacterium]MDD5380215.1 CPBP family intramembrane metalloprotease [Phycisphaerae bacterium]
MKEKRYSVSQLFNFAQDSYFERTSRPIYAIVFLLPFIAFYELGTILINTDLLRRYWLGRVVAFSWLQDFLTYLGFGSKFGWAATPLAVVVILLALQVASRKGWRFWFGDIFPMAIECILLAVPLIVLSMFLSGSIQRQSDADQFASSAARTQTAAILRCYSVAPAPSAEDGDWGLPTAEEDGGGDGKWQELLANVVTGIGAGIYEELVFRLILIVALMILFQDAFQLGHKVSIILSVFISAALFGAYHHIVFLGGQFIQSSPFNWAEFSFRTIAGIYFAVLFAIRGFGITAGAHAFYDIIAVFMNAFFTQP